MALRGMLGALRAAKHPEGRAGYRTLLLLKALTPILNVRRTEVVKNSVCGINSQRWPPPVPFQ